jgi:bacillithiol biosynthesis cysteine-adding enzyme BshC
MIGEGERRVVRVEDAPPSWFRRRQYRPRIRSGAQDVWFLLYPAFAPPRRMTGRVPREPLGGRTALRQAFAESQARFGIPPRPEAERSMALLAAAGTAVVVTGQQPGFLGGPLLTLYKALTAVAAARQYRALTGRPCVPVFWVASEDHDLDEVREARFPDPAKGVASFHYPHPADRRPLSDYVMDREALAVLEAAEAHLAPRRHGAEARDLLDLYRGRSLAGGFGAVISALLAHTGMLIIDPATLRTQASSLFRPVIERPEEALAAIERGRRDVKARGLDPLVAARVPLFMIREGRRDHLSLTAAGLEVDGGGPPLAREGLLRILRERPETFSPGALLRPIIQQATLPCVLTVGGPAEVGYFAQIGPLASYLGVDPPEIALRLNATIFEGKMARLASSYPPERLAAAEVPEDLLRGEEEPEGVRIARDLARRAEEELRRAIEGLSGSPETSRLEARAAEVPEGILRFADRLQKAHARARSAEMEAARRLWDFILPAGGLQERWWSALHFVAKHGRRWIDEVIEAIEPDPLRLSHRWIFFEGSETEG